MATKKAEVKFTKEQIVESLKYKKYRDILTALLDDTKEYSFDEADFILKDYLEREV